MARMLFPIVCLSAVLLAQAPPPPPTIRVDVNSIQFDVTVTDRKGHRVPSLKAADFEVRENGELRPVSSLLWIERQAGGKSPGSSPTVQLRAADVRRTIAIVLDDLSLRPEALQLARTAIERFVQTDVQPGDLVAIYRTSAGMSFLQQFSSDRTELLSALGRTSLQALNLSAARFNPPRDLNRGPRAPALVTMAREQIASEQALRRELDDARSAAALTSLQYLTRGLGDLPGRKSLILFSESLQLFDSPTPALAVLDADGARLLPQDAGGSRYRTVAAMHEVADLANRHGVVFYAVDPRGPALSVDVTGARAAPMFLGLRGTLAAINPVGYGAADVVGGLSSLVEATGGLVFRNTNDLASALQETLADQDGYYLLAFPPSASKAPGDAQFRRIEIRVKKPGLQLRYRRGYLPASDSRPASSITPVVRALASPFRAEGIPLRLTPVAQPFQKSPATNRLQALLHVDVSSLAYRDEPADQGDSNAEPWQVAEVQLAVQLFDPVHGPIQMANRSHRLRMRGATRRFALRHGLVLEFDLPVTRPGNYQVRAAAWEPQSGRTGSAAKFVPIPALTADRLTSSDLVISGDPEGSLERAARSSPALRHLAPGEKLNYAMMIYGARGTPDARLESQISLYQNGQLKYRGPARPLPAAKVALDKPISLEGFLTISPQSPPGDYVLEVAVHDLQAPRRSAFTVRAIDFVVQPPPPSVQVQ